MDGNGRWARRRGLPRSAGHAAGSLTFREISRYCNKIGIQVLTVYTLSTENWSRPQQEIDGILDLLRENLRDSKNFLHENIRVRFIGELSRFPQDIRELIAQAEEASAPATGMTLNLAVNYGGQDEIVHAVRAAAADVAAGKLAPDTITAADIEKHLYTAGQPPLDLIIRPSGELRLSNFLLWQSAYAELWFSDILWPSFKPRDLDAALEAFAVRHRRFGGV